MIYCESVIADHSVEPGLFFQVSVRQETTSRESRGRGGEGGGSDDVAKEDIGPGKE